MLRRTGPMIEAVVHHVKRLLLDELNERRKKKKKKLATGKVASFIPRPRTARSLEYATMLEAAMECAKLGTSKSCGYNLA